MSHVTLPEEQLSLLPWGELNVSVPFRAHFTLHLHTKVLCVHTEHQTAPSVCASGVNPSYLCTEHPVLLHICTSALMFSIRISSTWQIHGFLFFNVCVVCFSHEEMDPAVFKGPVHHVLLSLFQRWMWCRTSSSLLSL